MNIPELDQTAIEGLRGVANRIQSANPDAALAIHDFTAMAECAHDLDALVNFIHAMTPIRAKMVLLTVAQLAQYDKQQETP